MSHGRKTTLAIACLLSLAACSEAEPVGKAAPAPAAQATPPAPVAAAAVAQPEAPQDPAAVAVNAADLTQAGAKIGAADPVLIRAEVLLDRAHFSPGVIDGRQGANLAQAIHAFERAHALPEDGKLDPAVWQALTAGDAGPAIQAYVITEQDVAGPFTPSIPKDLTAMSKLDRLGYSGPTELLAEKFHMDEALLNALNPGADFGVAGTRILVAAPGTGELPAKVTLVEIDKSSNTLWAYGQNGDLVAAYPASVGSAERPAPSGEYAVRAVAPDPIYYYDPKRLTFGQDQAAGALKIAAGPNNPVGATWIALTIPTYGIHGSPDPAVIGKRQSHGCVRLTNWDAVELGKAIEKDAVVRFVGMETTPAKRTAAKSKPAAT
jgi:lipoprotein-anchoring transpeptidase ErfK/SrfK